MKLTPKITLVFVLYAVALLTSVAWLAYNSGRESLRAATVSELQSTAIEKQSALNEWVDEKRTDIEILAVSSANIENATLLNEAFPGSPEEQAAHDHFVMDIQPRVVGGEFLVIMLLDPDTGQVIAATDPSEEGKFKDDRPFFLKGKEGPYVQNVYYSISTQGPAMTAAAPLRSVDGKLLGVLAGRLNLDEMNAIINRQAGIWQTEEAFLVNTSHLFVTQPRLIANSAVLQHGVHTEAVDRCLAGSSGTLYDLDYRGNPALIVYRWLSGQDLCLIVKIDQDEALAPAYAFGRKVAAISGLALLSAILLGALFSRGITGPIRALQSGVSRFGQGDLDIRLPESARDELGDLAREFNRMAASLVEKDIQLHEYATNLELKIWERTAEIKQREERYRSYIEVTGQLGWTTNPQGEVEEDIPSWRKFTGQNEEEVKGWGWSQALHPDDLERATQAWNEAIATQTNYEVEYRVRRYDGVYRYFLIRGVPVHNDKKEVQEWVGTCIDITERRQAEEEVRASRAKLDAALASMSDAVFISDTQGNFLEFNDAFATFHKFKNKEECAKTFAEYPDILDVFMDTGELAPVDMWAVPRALRGEVGTNVEYSLRRKDTGETWVGSYSFAPIRDQDGAIVGSVVVGRDITDQKRTEQEIANLSKFPTENPNPVLRVQNDGQVIYANKASQELLELWDCEVNGYLPKDIKDLILGVVESGDNKSLDIPCNDKIYAIMLVPIIESRYVNMYGSEITDRKRAEEDLYRTLDELKRSNAELEQFAYVASHDLQEPLRGIAGFAQLIQHRYQGQLDSRADEYITHIVDGTQRMQTLINDLLAYSRIGRRGEPIQVIKAEAALQASLENLNLAIQEYGASITSEGLPTVQADPTQLIQLFQNLIGNALKFRAERTPHIHIGATAAGDFWQFSVHDNGIGIEPQYFERIFQVFQRLHTRREYKGTGIGLAICKKIVERNGGRIWVESEVGQGTTFYFTLPKG